MSQTLQLLYVSPVMPAFTGNGLAMRAAAVLEALADHFRIRLLVVPLYPPFDRSVPEPIATLCHQSVVVPPRPMIKLPSMDTPADLRIGAASKVYADVAFDCVHVYRLAALDYARAYLEPARHPAPQKWLDLCDTESVIHWRLARIYRAAGNEVAALREDQESKRYRLLEATVLQEFDRVYICSETDGVRLGDKSAADIRVLPNTIRPPEPPVPEYRGDFSLLFVGTLGYYPNEDAVRFLATEILPGLRERVKKQIPVCVVGSGATTELLELAKHNDIKIVGDVRDVRPWYEKKSAVVVPIRAAGGTRIKVLEAFAFRRPVVSTSLGIEGLDVRDGRHFLLADDADSFAEQCRRLCDDPALSAYLVEQSYHLLMHSYTPDKLRRAVFP